MVSTLSILLLLLEKKKTFDANHFQIFDFFSKIIIKIDNL